MELDFNINVNVAFLIYKIANKYQWSGEKRRFWLAQRFRVTGWLIIFELLICENFMSILY
jgi:hypothetical protein